MRDASRLLLMLFTLGITSCGLQTPFAPSSSPGVTPAPGGTTGPRVIGTLTVAGPDVFLNGTHAKSGTPVYDGGTVTTGADSSGLVQFAAGGSAQIDQNTDPGFRFKLLTEGWCLVMEIAKGQILVDGGSGCMEIQTPDGSGFVHSKVNVKVVDGQTTWTVLQGAVQLTELAATVSAYQGITVSKGKLLRRTNLSMADLAALTKWQSRYDLASVLSRVPGWPGNIPLPGSIPPLNWP